jgi:hypothetical protein
MRIIRLSAGSSRLMITYAQTAQRHTFDKEAAGVIGQGPR